MVYQCQLTVNCICGTVTSDKLLRMICDIAVACSNIKLEAIFLLLLASKVYCFILQNSLPYTVVMILS